MSGFAGVEKKIGLFVCVVLGSSTLHAATPKNYSAPPMQMKTHVLFQNLYGQPAPKSSKGRLNQLAQSIKDLRSMGRMDLAEGISMKISRVNSGPLSPQLTEMVTTAPGIQTHEGRIADNTKGYGISLSFKF